MMIEAIETTPEVFDPLEIEQPKEFWAAEEDETAVDPDGTINKDNSRKAEQSPWDHQSPERKNAKYPPDCYSFLSLHGPLENPTFFSFGVVVWAFQVRCSSVDRSID